MYEAHFGLDAKLFDGGIAQETAVFMGPRQQTIAANFDVALSTFDSVIVLTGPAGVGKTTLTAAALRMTHTRLALGWLPSTPTTGAELVETLLAEFGFSAHRVGRVERLQMWRQFLNEMNATDTRVFVIAERADAMDVEVLRALESVTAADPNGCPGANLILLGGADLGERLKAPALASLAQRVRLRQRLEPLTLAELEAYLKRRVAAAGGALDEVLVPAAIAALHRFANGLPRAVNNLCETALTVAAAQGERPVRADLVTRLAVELLDATPEIESVVTPEATAPMSGAARQPQHARAGADEFPVLTDAIEPSADPDGAIVPPAGTVNAPIIATKHDALPSATQPANPPSSVAHPAARPSPTVPAAELATSAVPATTPSALTARAASAPSAAPTEATANPRSPASAIAAAAARQDDDLAHHTQTLRALAIPRSLDDVDAAMAETPFGDSDLDMLSTALASAGWSDDDADSEDLLDEHARTSVEDSVTIETPRDAYASFGRKTGSPLSLLDETVDDDDAPPRAVAKR